MSEKYVIVHRTYDPIQADIIGQILRENEIAARVLGTRHGAVIGVAQNILQQHIEVPASQAGEATDFLEAFFEGDGAELLADQDFDDDEALEAAEEQVARDPDIRRPLLAGGSVALLFAGSHFYSRRTWTALVIVVGQAIAVYNIMHDQWSAVVAGVTMFSALLLLDFIGGQFAVRAYNRGARPSPFRQLITGAAFVAAAGTLGAVVGPRVDQPEADKQHHEAPTYFVPGN
jgi:hypothetical protein